jgi:hypothetical protein
VEVRNGLGLHLDDIHVIHLSGKGDIISLGY